MIAIYETLPYMMMFKDITVSLMSITLAHGHIEDHFNYGYYI